MHVKEASTAYLYEYKHFTCHDFSFFLGFLVLLLMLDSPGDSYVLVPNIYVGKSPNKGLLVAIA